MNKKAFGLLLFGALSFFAGKSVRAEMVLTQRGILVPATAAAATSVPTFVKVSTFVTPNAGASTVTGSFNNTATTNMGMLVCAGGYNTPTINTATATYAGVSLTQVKYLNPSSGAWVAMFFSTVTATGSNTITVGVTPNTTLGWGVAVAVYNNVNQTTPYTSFTSSATTANTTSVTTQTVTSALSNLDVDCVYHNNDATTAIVAGGSQTQRLSQKTLVPNNGFGGWLGISEIAGVASGTNSFTWTSTADKWGQIVTTINHP